MLLIKIGFFERVARIVAMPKATSPDLSEPEMQFKIKAPELGCDCFCCLYVVSTF